MAFVSGVTNCPSRGAADDDRLRLCQLFAVIAAACALDEKGFHPNAVRDKPGKAWGPMPGDTSGKAFGWVDAYSPGDGAGEIGEPD